MCAIVHGMLLFPEIGFIIFMILWDEACSHGEGSSYITLNRISIFTHFKKQSLFYKKIPYSIIVGDTKMNSGD